MYTDSLFILQWWFYFFLLGLLFLPTTILLFPQFYDRGYIFSKIIGMVGMSYVVFVLGLLKFFPFERTTLIGILIVFTIINFFLIYKKISLKELYTHYWKIFLFEEILFILALFFWSFIRGFQPDIHGLEKYMDFGFVNAILRTNYFPPPDMWFTPLSINYYYFGHLVTAVLTKLSDIPSAITYNLMIATIFAFTFTCSFSLGLNLISTSVILNSFQDLKKNGFRNKFGMTISIAGGLLTGFLISFGGNLHTIYTFFKPYVNETPVPIWQLEPSFSAFPNSYWYPNATRFIQNTIHEFPLYSFVVSDLHGHVIDIPFVLFTIAILFSLLNSKHETRDSKDSGPSARMTSSWGVKRLQDLFRISNLDFRILLLGFLLAVMYMTNAWDGIIYFLLTIFVIFYIRFKYQILTDHKESIKYSVLSIMLTKKYILHTTCYILLLSVGFFLFSIPFSLYFKPFVSGIGVVCAPEFLTNIGKFGPLLFEVDHCQKSPLWQLVTLYGFFYFLVISFLFIIIRREKPNTKKRNPKDSMPSARMTSSWGVKQLQDLFLNSKFEFRILSTSDIFVLILIFLSSLLIIIPELVYAKDIYPAHYRANTMFKLVYQSFMMLSIASGYIIIRIVLRMRYPFGPSSGRGQVVTVHLKKKILYTCYLLLTTSLLLLVLSYSYYAISSYYGNLQLYRGLDGTAYLKQLYPTDYEAIVWLNKNIVGTPVILEAQGDSYTDYARVSANTGLPTVLGWTVHEWLWRGTYDIPAPRIDEVKTLYEIPDIKAAKKLIKKYNIEYVFVGDLERQKYPSLLEAKFGTMGKIIYQNGNTKIYHIIEP